MLRTVTVTGIFAIAAGHGLLLEPRPRSAGEGLTSLGGSFWYSQSCTIGCAECNVSASVPGSMMAGDLCPEDHSGDKVPTINDSKLRTAMGDGCLDPKDSTKRVACTPQTEHTDWTKFHPWRAPGRAPMYDPCGMAGASPSNNSQAAGGWGYTTGYPQGFQGSRLPALAGEKPVWTAGGIADVSWVSVANHGGGYQYALCPLKDGEVVTEECFQRHPLHYVDDKQTLRYIYLNNSANVTEARIDAVRVSVGTVPEGSAWTRNPVPTGVLEPEWASLSTEGSRNGREPEFAPPQGCDEHCWGYQPCNVGFAHPSFEGWNDPKRPPNKWMPMPGKPAPAEFPTCANGQDGEGCCHTSAYMAVIDQVRVPNVPPGDYVLRWRWDCELTPQIWANCADVTIKADVSVHV